MHSATDIAADLVRIPSVNPMGRSVPGELALEGRVTDYLEAFFRNLGAQYERQPVAPQRDNIIARYPADNARLSLLWDAHQDTVPVDGMTIDPFVGRLENGKLYGRGACDVKGGMAAMLAAFARLVREKPADAGTVVLACTVDEEHTCLGVHKLAAAGIAADMAVVAEPTNLNIVNAHKGTMRWRVETHGRACHSSSPEMGVNAIYRMGQVLIGVEKYAAALRSGSSDDMLGPPSISAGVIRGGASVNTVPDFCSIDVDRRLIPGEQPQEAIQRFQDYLRHTAGVDVPFDCQPPWVVSPALDSAASGELTEKLGAAINAVRGDHQVHAVSYGTNAGPLSQEAGIPTVVFGPGDVAQAHTRDEWIAVDEIEQASEILFSLARNFCS